MTTPIGPDDMDDADLQVVLATVAARKAEAADKKRRLEEHNARVREEKRLRTTPRFVDALGTHPLLKPIRAKVSSLTKPGPGKTARGEMLDGKTGRVHTIEAMEIATAGEFVIESKARPATWGHDIRVRLEGRDVRFSLSPRSYSLGAITVGGVMPEDASLLRSAIVEAEPLVRADLAREQGVDLASAPPPRVWEGCEWCGEPTDSLVFPGRAPICRACVMEARPPETPKASLLDRVRRKGAA